MKLAEGEAKVLREGFEWKFPAGGADLLFGGFEAAHFEAGGAEGFGAAHAGGDFLLYGGVEKMAELVVQIAFEAVFVEEGVPSGGEISEEWHGRLLRRLREFG